jgi:predicted RNase H-like HicB family nuclease
MASSPASSPGDELGEALAIPYVLDVSTRPGAGGQWVCHLEYVELEGCVAEARDALDALDQLERMREQWLRNALGAGRPIPRPRAALRS